MYICKNCGAKHATPLNFCSQCGSNQIVKEDPIAAAYPGSTPYTPYSSHSTAPYATSGGSKAPAIMGISFGGVALFLAFYMIIMMAVAADSYYYYGSLRSSTLWGLFFGFLLFALPGSIVGMAQSCKATELKGLATAGKVLSIISFVLLGIGFFDRSSKLLVLT